MAELSEGLFLLKLKSGNGVLFGKWSGTGVKIDGEDLLIMKETDVISRNRKVHPHSR